MFRRISADHNKFANVCAGVESVVIAIGVIIAGVWTYLLYHSLKQPQSVAVQLVRDQAAIVEARRDAEKTHLETERIARDLNLKFGQVTLTTTPLHETRNVCYLQVNATIANGGNREIRVDFTRRAPLHVAAITFDRAGNQSMTPLLSASVSGFSDTGLSVGALPSSSLVPGEKSTFPFLIRIPAKRFYLLEFSVPVDTIDSEPAVTRGIAATTSKKHGWLWGARSYVRGCSSTPNPST